MRGIVYVLATMGVIALAFWAYRETHQTQRAEAQMRALQSEVAALREAIAVQRAEWAYLNRPDRLRALVALNFDHLVLLPIRPEQFGDPEQVAYPPFELPAPLSGSVETMLDPDTMAETMAADPQEAPDPIEEDTP